MQAERPHAVCIPFPAQGHISAMLKLAKLLHHKGFHITYVLTQQSYDILKSRNFLPITNFPDFRFETIPDGLPSREKPGTLLDINEVCFSTAEKCGAPFKELIDKLNSAADVPRVSCVVSDTFMPFTVGAAEEVGVPVVMYWPLSAAASMLYIHSPELREKLSKHKDAISEDYIIDWVPGIKSIHLRDIPPSSWSTDPNDPFINYIISVISESYKASAAIFNTFDELEHDVCNALSSLFNRVYTIGPIPLLLRGVPESEIDKIGCKLWKEDNDCIPWLDSKAPKSVIYVSFGSLLVTSSEKLMEFVMGLRNSTHNFLWIIRPELVSGGDKALPTKFLDEIQGQGYIASWCDQEQVLNHPSVGGFLTHCGWNSMLESMCAGVAMICWSVFADQPTNRLCCCHQWGFGIEMENDVKREDVERVVRDLMEGEKGREVKRKAIFWKERAKEATNVGGSSFLNLEKLIDEGLMSDRLGNWCQHIH